MNPVLPPRLVTRMTSAFERFTNLQASGGSVLLVATLVALVVANTAWADDYNAFWNGRLTVAVGSAELSYPLWYWINDGLMAIFFFVIGLEIKRELTWGELRDRRNVVLPAVGAIGGAIVPVTIYLVMQPSAPGRDGWAVPMATDIAFVVACLAVLGPRVPPALKIFMLSLAIVDDLLAVVIIAVVFSTSIDMVWVGGAVAGLAAIVVLNWIGVRRVGIYAMGGAGIWVCTLNSGIHPTVAGVLLGLLTPATAWIGRDKLMQVAVDTLAAIDTSSDPRASEYHTAAETLATAANEAVSPLERLEHGLHGWVVFAIMPVFALANAGVQLSAASMTEPVALAVIVSLVVGKPAGIAGAAWLAVKVGIARLPDDTPWSAILGAALLGGIGFTMALFIASLSVSEPLLAATKAGILVGSAIAMIGGVSLLAWALRSRDGSSGDT